MILQTMVGIRNGLMSGTVRARVKRGMLELLDQVDIPEDTEGSEAKATL